ncbi:ABC transporter permease subunit [Clostridium sp. MCC353]|uniref:amino acid ABC transporter permease n=1 Tax=Clostridium sp. MCC353 TaxID=2592646 RepID=UPI001C02CD6A|nr:amino acid ABC transporter permease [Clostridium sp. MCC353]MBS6645314.1 amino acid ABC transporter permease [Clostridiaceae bacterium]MBT9776523.1 ABC transporter permease subunit [Clostridium sp. MCC353]
MWENFKRAFYLNFIEKERWRYITDGLRVTLTVTFFAVLIGIVLGFLVAMIRSTYEKTGKLKILNALCSVYLTIIRGTPVVVQLLIIYFVIFGSVDINKVVAAVLAFGINSGAYVAEIFRSGIMSIDAGQFEAGRSLGFNYSQTMWYIIMPQAFKNVLPTLGNEFIVLLKETSVAGYIALQDLTKGGDIIRSRTYNAFLPLMAVAIIYLVMVMVFSYFVKCLERRLRKSER